MLQQQVKLRRCQALTTPDAKFGSCADPIAKWEEVPSNFTSRATFTPTLTANATSMQHCAAICLATITHTPNETTSCNERRSTYRLDYLTH
jgi:hypothetical protein